MKAFKFGTVILAAMLLGGSGVSFAADKSEKADRGKKEYDGNCAICHGVAGKGDGPYREFISKIPDLTVLAKNNKGVFPINRVYEVVDGRQVLKAHGTRDMPIWGREYSIAAAELYRDVDYDQEAIVRARILSLIDYLYRIQAK
ncbi:MAG: cytochrome c [Burkholderiales bacterium]|nr:cytochrome c [Burkholderiales bacterium]